MTRAVERSSAPAVVTVGVHPNNHTLFALRRRGLLEPLLARQNAVVDWVEFDDGRCTIDLFAEGEIDFGGTGSMPPIQAQSEGVDIVYVAVSDPRPSQGALVVPPHSPIRAASQLRGRRIALMDGSYHTELLAAVLESAGMGYGDVTVLDGLAEENKAAFESGEADAWVAGDPYFTAARQAGSVRVLAEAGSRIANRSVWWARRDFADRRPELLDTVVRALVECDAWIAAHPRRAAEMFAAAVPCSPGTDVWETSLRRRPWGPRPVTEEVVAEQQAAADRYTRLGMISAAVSVADAVPAPAPTLLAGHAPAPFEKV